MNCPGCGYTLWNIRDRRCPECGRDFLPSQFEFVVNSVRFCCPHCEQDYYGTGERGHLLPIAFPCVRCSTFIHMDQTVLLPTEGVTEAQTLVGRNPWAQGVGFGSFFRTFGRSLGSPVRLALSVPADGSPFRALSFAIIVNIIAFIASFAWFPLALFALSIFAAGAGAGSLGMYATFIGVAIIAISSYILLPWLWARLAHLFLRLTGPTQGGFDLTASAIGYTSAPVFILGIPCLGLYIGWMGYIWWIAAAAVALGPVQRVPPWRAILAAILPPLLLVVGVGGTVAGGIWYMSAGMNSAAVARGRAAAAAATAAGNPGLPGGINSSLSRGMTLSLNQFATTMGRWPVHGAEILTLPGNSLQVTDITGWSGVGVGVPVGSMELGEFLVAAPTTQQPEVFIAASALPANVVAHRFGDWVFTYHGQPISPAQPGLWLAVLYPEPSGSQPLPVDVTVVLRADTQTTIPRSQFAQMLARQNELRAKEGLPPLPADLGTVTADAPAVAPAGDGAPVTELPPDELPPP